MKNDALEFDNLSQATPIKCPVEAKLSAGDTDLNETEEDGRLISRCLEGEVKAWETLYSRSHPALLSSINVLLGGEHSDPNLVDEIAARIWYALIENDGRLLRRYDPARGARLITFLKSVAKTEIRRHFRRERRRQRRERIARSGSRRHHTDDAETAAIMGELVPSLTRAEREFYEQHLTGRPSGEAGISRVPLSANARQLTHRVRRKLLRLLGCS